MPAFQDPVQDDLKAMGALMAEQLQTPVTTARQMAEHLLGAGGKRLRALCTLLSARACGYDGQLHIRLGAALEFIHAATLLHDDVVDDSGHRRGRATANSIWGNSNSVLGGDFLYSRAFQLLAGLDRLAIIRLMADTTNQMAEGEIKQAQYQPDNQPDEQEYLQIIHKKTAILFSAAAASGAMLADAPDEEVQALAEFGAALGTAYQMQDDILDLEGDPAQMGKTPGDDLSAGRPSLPLIHAMKKSSGALRQAVSCASPELSTVRQLVRDAGGMDYARAQIATYLIRAKAHLIPLKDGPCKVALQGLADFTADRKH